eukprot:1582849-Rhodomonas_salina.3
MILCHIQCQPRVWRYAKLGTNTAHSTMILVPSYYCATPSTNPPYGPTTDNLAGILLDSRPTLPFCIAEFTGFRVDLAGSGLRLLFSPTGASLANVLRVFSDPFRIALGALARIEERVVPSGPVLSALPATLSATRALRRVRYCCIPT